MNCLLTGGYGFLGRYVYDALAAAGDQVIRITRQPGIQPAELNIHCDLARAVPDLGTKTIDKVVHVAGKAHSVPRTPEEAQVFYDVNKTGLQHLLAALEQLPHPPRVFVNISTVAVYGSDAGELIDEGHPLNATTPYGISKIMGEELVAEWCTARGIHFYNLRLPLIVGDRPPGNLGKMVRAIQRGYYLRLKGNDARKSMVLASDVARLVVKLKDKPSGAYNLTDGYHPPVKEMEQALEQVLDHKIRFQLGKGTVAGLIKIGNLAKLAGRHNPVDNMYRKLTASLTFSDEKARKELGWNPENVLNYLPNLTF